MSETEEVLFGFLFEHFVTHPASRRPAQNPGRLDYGFHDVDVDAVGGDVEPAQVRREDRAAQPEGGRRNGRVHQDHGGMRCSDGNQGKNNRIIAIINCLYLFLSKLWKRCSATSLGIATLYKFFLRLATLSQ